MVARPVCRDFFKICGILRIIVWVTGDDSPAGELFGDAPRELGSRKVAVPTAASVAPASNSSRAWRALCTPPMPDDRDRDALRDGGDLSERDGTQSPGRRGRR